MIDTRNDDVKVKNAVDLIYCSFMLLFYLNILNGVGPPPPMIYCIDNNKKATAH